MKKAESTLNTKKNLAIALKTRLKTEEFEKITVSSLIKDCKITRATFYYHFEDIYDLLKWILETEILEILKQDFNIKDWKNTLARMFSYLYENKEICRCIYELGDRGQFQKFLFAEIRPIIEKFLITVNDEVVFNKDMDFIIDFYVGAVINVIERWSYDGMKESPEKTIDLICLILEGGIIRFSTRLDNLRKV